jgi:dethiobiotin synthetase
VGKIIFVTGTDTGVGKTVFTALLVSFLRKQAFSVLAVKPFCSGDRADAELLEKLQEGDISLQAINPYHFSEPLAPLVAAQRAGQSIPFKQVLRHIRTLQSQCDLLIVEGCGGLLVPIAEGFLISDLIAKLSCSVVVVARNQLGVINHALLTVKALEQLGKKQIRVVLMGSECRDVATETNPEILSSLLYPIELLNLPYLGPKPLSQGRIHQNNKEVFTVLARIKKGGTLRLASRAANKKTKNNKTLLTLKKKEVIY